MFRRKLNAGALQFTLLIAVIIALLLAAFILLVHSHKRFRVQTDFIIETAQNTNKGIQYTLQNSVKLHDTTAINLNDEDYKTLKVYRDFWGLFEKLTVVSKIKKNTIKSVALIGGTQTELDRTALYVKDNNKPLVLVGNTKIEGTAYLPKQGVKSGTISGQSYYGNQLIYGNSKVSSDLPKLFNQTLAQLLSLGQQLAKLPQNQYLNIESGKTYSNSFLKQTQIVFSNSSINLNTIKLTGNIIVQSKTKIVVEASSNLKDIILIAPEIDIQNNVKGHFQAIASKQLVVGTDVELEYPSALILIEKDEKQDPSIPQNNTSPLMIHDNAVINGVVLYLGAPKPNNFKVQVDFKEKATLVGELYCNQNLELKGTVYGTVYTNNFIAKQAGSVYQNHIYNGTISVEQLAQEYVGLTFNASKKGIVKWLY